MTEEKQKKIDDILDTDRSRQKTILRGVVICLLVVLMAAGAFVAFLQLQAFEIVDQPMTVETYIGQAMNGASYGSDGLVLTVPEDVVAGTVKQHVEEVLSVTNVQLKAIAYDSATGRTQMNLSYLGYYLPLSYQTDMSQLEDGIILTLRDPAVGRGLLPVSFGMGRIIPAVKRLEDSHTTLHFGSVGVNPYLSFNELLMVDGLPMLKLTIDEEAVQDELLKIEDAASSRLVDYYRSFDSERTAPVLEMIDDYGVVTDSDVVTVINDVLHGSYLLNDLLLLTEGYDTSGLTELMSRYGQTIDLKAIANERKAFKGHAVDGEISVVFEALDLHFSEKIMAFNQGKPFDIETMTTMTVEKFVEVYDLEVDDELASELSFVYDGEFKVAYRLDDTAYYIRSIGGYEVVDTQAYIGYLGAGDYVEPYEVTDLEQWVSITEAAAVHIESEKVFVRYMKSDGESTFAVVSPVEDPQTYYGMALMLSQGTLSVLDSQVTGIASLIESHPDFNVATATKAIESVAFKRIGDDIHDLIIEEMYGQRKITTRTDTAIVYSAYDGKKYIAFRLSNGDEYVYKVQITVYGTYLADLYTKEKAKRNWSDIPELLLLQDGPVD